MSVNPFKDWTAEMVEEHNRRHQHGKKLIQQLNERTRPEAAARPPQENLHSTAEPAQQEHHLRHGPDAQVEAQEKHSEGVYQLAQAFWRLFPRTKRFHTGHQETQKKYLIIVIDYRQKLIDEDNLEAKWIIDCLRYCDWIPEDNPQTCRSVVTQCLVDSPEEVGVQIEIIEL